MKLFVIEGLDGSGKSSQIKMLEDFFESKDFLCEHIHFPRTDTPWFGELIARFLRGEFGSLNKVDPYLVAMLYAGDRKDAAPLINRWLDENKVILIDRYTYSNIAYQCAKIEDIEEQNKLKDWIFKLEFEYFSIPKPSINIFLDVPFYFTKDKLTSGRNGSDRNYLNGQNDIHESNLIFQMRVREMYINIARNDTSLAVINCAASDGLMLPPERIFTMITELLKEKELI